MAMNLLSKHLPKSLRRTYLLRSFSTQSKGPSLTDPFESEKNPVSSEEGYLPNLMEDGKPVKIHEMEEVNEQEIPEHLRDIQQEDVTEEETGYLKNLMDDENATGIKSYK